MKILRSGRFILAALFTLSCATFVFAQDTPLQGSRLLIEDVPVAVYCSQCKTKRVLESVQMFACPECGAPTGEVLQGKELEVFALEKEE